MSSASPTSRRGRAACVFAGWLHYVIGFFMGVVLGIGLDASLDTLAGRNLESWSHVQYEMQAVVILGGGAASLLGLLMGWRSYGPARDAAAGLNPKPSAFLQTLLAIRRRGVVRLLRLLGELLYARFAVLTGASSPFRTALLVLVVLLVGAVVAFTVFMGRDSEFFVAGYLGGGVAVLIADCLLVNRIASWRTAGRMGPK